MTIGAPALEGPIGPDRDPVVLAGGDRDELAGGEVKSTLDGSAPTPQRSIFVEPDHESLVRVVGRDGAVRAGRGRGLVEEAPRHDRTVTADAATKLFTGRDGDEFARRRWLRDVAPLDGRARL